MIDWLNDNSGAIQAASAVVLALTFIAVAYYACQTRRQAKATAAMASEMSEQRLSSDRPILVIDFPEDATTDDEELPKDSLPLRVYNAGRGPAVSVAALFFRPPAKFPMVQSGALLSGETWQVRIRCSPEPGELKDVAWIRQLIQEFGNARTNAHAIALYMDIHGRGWVTALEIDWQPEDETVALGAQKFIRLQNPQ